MALAISCIATLFWPADFSCLAAEESFAPVQTIESGNFRLALPLGLDATKFLQPDDNIISKEKVELGRMLFFDARLSVDNSISCAS